MTKTMTRILFMLAVAFTFAACSGGPKGEAADTKDAVDTDTKKVSETAASMYEVQPEGKLTWEATKAIGGGHNGTIDIKAGSIKVEGGKISGGKFEFDINSLVALDLDEKSGKGKLEGHLKSADFFDAEQFPTASFVVTGVNAISNNPDATHAISGNLTLKDQEKNITFMAKVDMAGDNINVSSPQFTIDRTDWGMKYGSGKFFDNPTKDKVINDKVGIAINFTAAKKAEG